MASCRTPPRGSKPYREGGIASTAITGSWWAVKLKSICYVYPNEELSSDKRIQILQKVLRLGKNWLTTSILSLPPSEATMPSAVELESLAVEVPETQAKLKSTSSTPPLPVTVPSVSLTTGVDAAALQTASKILHIIDRYRLRRSADTAAKADEGALKFLALIYTHVKAGDVVPMCLPAFPFKSPNFQSKVLGKLPDRAEELALAHLNGLCLAIRDIYPPGANLTIISDGLVYNGTPH